MTLSEKFEPREFNFNQEQKQNQKQLSKFNHDLKNVELGTILENECQT